MVEVPDYIGDFDDMFNDIEMQVNETKLEQTDESQIITTDIDPEIRKKQFFNFILKNQILQGQDGSVLYDPNNYLYLLNRPYKADRYYKCLKVGCNGRAIVVGETVLKRNCECEKIWVKC